MTDLNGIKRTYTFKLESMFKASKKTLFVFEDNPPKPPSSLLEKIVDKIAYPKRLKEPEKIVEKLIKGEKLRFELGKLEREVKDLEDLDKLARDWGLSSPEEEIILPNWARGTERTVDSKSSQDGFLLSDSKVDAFLKPEITKGVKGAIRFLELGISPEKAINSIVEEKFREIKEIAPEIAKLSDEELRAKTLEFKKRIAKGEDMLSILPEAYAVVAEAAKRVLGYYPYDVQFKGAIALALGTIIEMKTGEGKTLTSTMPIYLHALLGRGVHVATANEYLAKRDAQNMGKVFQFLGLSTGYVIPGMSPQERREAYRKDITYGTIEEFGFDFLRDTLATSEDQTLQRGREVLLVDEADFVMLDDAVTPLIISGPGGDGFSPQLLKTVDKAIKTLKKDVDFKVDERYRRAYLTDEGISKLERILKVDNLYDLKNFDLLCAVDNALQANYVLKRDVDYIIEGGKVKLVSDKTGRIMDGRTYSFGLQQAIEVKEGLEITPYNSTLARISITNYIKSYRKVMGMTGTAMSSKEFFGKVYGLPVVPIPTHKPVIRKDHKDIVFRTRAEKYDYLLKLVKKLHNIGRPILIGTTSVEESERISKLLREAGIPHQVLNAKYHEREAEIIAKAGQRGAVTVATNMAGRGVDIKLPEEVKRLGGLFVIGTEHSTSKRVDEQLRGRAGRQGDPGDSVFIVSLEDDIIKRYIGDVKVKLDLSFGTEISSKATWSLFEKAQEKAERELEGTLEELNKYDSNVNLFRDYYLKYRDKVMKAKNPEELMKLLLEDYWKLSQETSRGSEELYRALVPYKDKEKLLSDLLDRYKKLYGSDPVPLKNALLSVLSIRWAEYTEGIDEMRRLASFRALAGEDPETAFRRISSEEFGKVIALSIRDLFWSLLTGNGQSREV